MRRDFVVYQDKKTREWVAAVNTGKKDEKTGRPIYRKLPGQFTTRAAAFKSVIQGD